LVGALRIGDGERSGSWVGEKDGKEREMEKRMV
jgi:hypothetical protein